MDDPPASAEPVASPAPLAPLDYRGSEARALRAVCAPPRRFSIPTFIAAAGMTALLLFLVAMILPQLEQTFHNAGAPLPPLTRIFFGLSHLLAGARLEYLGIPIALAVGAAAGFLPLRGRGLRLLLTLIMAVVVVAFALAVLLPVVDLMTKLSGNGR